MVYTITDWVYSRCFLSLKVLLLILVDPESTVCPEEGGVLRMNRAAEYFTLSSFMR